MGFRSHWPLRRTRRGIELHLGEEERELLGALIADQREHLGEDSPDLRRLFPTAYLEDPERDMEYQLLARSELMDKRIATLSAMQATLENDILDEEQSAAWLQGINQLRLEIGTRLDVSEDDEFDPTHPDAPDRAVYEYLGVILEHLVRALVP